MKRRYGRILTAVPVTLAALAVVFGAAGCTEKSKTQGITDTEIVLGSHQPLSGPVALIGVPVANGMRMRVEEINAAGGIHGRKIKLIIEDTAYQQSKAAQAGDKLLKKDKIFAMVGATGTPTNMVTMPAAIKMGVPNLFPITAAVEMFEPLHKYKFAFIVPYYDQIRASVNHFVSNEGKKRIAVMYQDDDMGLNMFRGARDQAAALGLELVEVTTYKRGAKDFSSQIAKMKAADADLVVLGTIIAESIGAKVAALQIGWKVDMVAANPAYFAETAELAKGAAHGLYATTDFEIPYEDVVTGELAVWAAKYKEKYGARASTVAMGGYMLIEMFREAAERTGKDLTADGLSKALETFENYTTIFGGPPINFSADDHLGPDRQRSMKLVRINGTRWETVGSVSY